MKDGKTYTLDAIKTAIFYYSLLEPVLPCNRYHATEIKEAIINCSKCTFVWIRQLWNWKIAHHHPL